MQRIDGQPVYAATDLVGFLACTHRLALERAAFADLVDRPERNDPSIELIAKRGTAHEQRYRDELVASGRSVVEIHPDGSIAERGDQLRAAAAATIAALRSGVDVVYQATFFDGRWVGYADFLLRVERASELGSWSYEVADTKLARHVKGSAVLQVCSYVEQLTRVQGLEPEWLHVVLGGSARETAKLPVSDYMAYFRRVKAAFEEAVAADEAAYPVTATYPEPVEHCEVCRWAVHCKAQRRRDDDLSLVAGITARQRTALKARGVATRRGLAGLALPMVPRLDRVSAESLERVHEQARIQVAGEDARAALWELLEPERGLDGALVPDRGLLGLPEPSPGDLFFDIEGDPFALEDGVEYLFGVLEPALEDPARPGEPRFHEIWSRDAAGDVTRGAEKAAFERLVDLVMGRWEADPTLHVYHYAAYERAALGRLAQRHATREDEVDRLLRADVLVDLYRIVKQSLRASVESYSIKRLEPLYGLEREVELRSAGSSIVAFEAWLEDGKTENGAAGESILAEIAGYNRDDVLSNWRLRDWLEARRPDLALRIGGPVPRLGAGAPPEEQSAASERDARVAALAGALTEGFGDDPATWSRDDAATWLLAQLLGWHRREDKAYWWRYYELLDLSDEALVDEREPLGAIVFLDELGEAGRNGLLERYAFPRQDHGVKIGGTVVDPATRRSTGTVQAIDDVGLTIVLKRTRSELDRGRPTSLVPYDYVKTDGLQGALFRIGESVLANGIDGPGPQRAARDVLLRHPPRLLAAGEDGRLRREGESTLDAACRLALTLDEGTLAIQGPPGSGKTFTGARMIVELVRAGRRVGVTANSHKVIGNLLDEVALAAAGDPRVRLGQRTGQDGERTCEAAIAFTDTPPARAALDDGTVTVLGGTAWLWSNEAMIDAVDVLVADEAGQLALANAIAVSPAARSLVLLGDPQQLDQPLKGSHPPGAERSALGHLLADRPTLPPDEGLFLDRTWRLHPDLCAFTSELFYARQLMPEPDLEHQVLSGMPPADGTGLRWLPVEHSGNATEAREEADAIAALIAGLLGGNPTWTDAALATRPLTLTDIIVIAPYNAHVELIGATLASAGYPGARVGTVDKFQGQQAVLSIYSMASSSAEEAPRGLEFLYSRNRLNVATSRARCVAIVVASPELVRVQCQTPHQMRLANALCRLVEVAHGA